MSSGVVVAVSLVARGCCVKLSLIDVAELRGLWLTSGEKLATLSIIWTPQRLNAPLPAISYAFSASVYTELLGERISDGERWLLSL